MNGEAPLPALLNQLMECAKCLPENIPMAIPTDAIAVFGHNGEQFMHVICEGKDADEIWEEVVNPELHLLQGTKGSAVEAIVQREPDGRHGFSAALLHLVHTKVIDRDGAILHECIKKLLDAVE